MKDYDYIYVLARNIQEFRHYLYQLRNENKFNSKAKYVFISNQEVLRGIDKPKVILYGRCSDRQDYRDIYLLAKNRQAEFEVVE